MDIATVPSTPSPSNIPEQFWDAAEIAAYLAESVSATLARRRSLEIRDIYHDSAHQRFIIAQVSFTLAARVDWDAGHEILVFGAEAAGLIVDHFVSCDDWNIHHAVRIACAALAL